MNFPNAPVVVVGLGQLGSVLSEGFLRAGYPVVPVLRRTPPESLSQITPEPALVLVTVGEDDLAPAVSRLPSAWRSKLGLVQNELLPDQWLTLKVTDPTVAIVWFEKKAGRPIHDVLPTVVSGPRADLVGEALDALGVPKRIAPEEELLEELVAKNLYILVLNLAGLEAEGVAGDLLAAHRPLFDALTGEVLELQRALVTSAARGSAATGSAAAQLDDDRLRATLERAIASDPAHGLAGRSAPRRLERNVGLARRLGLTLPTFERLAQRFLPSADAVPTAGAVPSESPASPKRPT